MKREYLFWTIAIVLTIVVLLVFLIPLMKTDGEKPRTVGEFSVEEYQWYLENFPENMNVGEVNDADTAIEKAQSLWSEEYGGDFPAEKIKVAYDTAEECWLVRYSNSPHSLGGANGVLIRKNGDVLAIWFED